MTKKNLRLISVKDYMTFFLYPVYGRDQADEGFSERVDVEDPHDLVFCRENMIQADKISS